jgi:hypothetical protein
VCRFQGEKDAIQNERRRLAIEFGRLYANNEALLASVSRANQDALLALQYPTDENDPISFVRDFAMLKDDISVASTAENSQGQEEEEQEEEEYIINEDDDDDDDKEEFFPRTKKVSNREEGDAIFRFFDIDIIQVSVPVPPTKEQMNPLTGYEIMPCYKAGFQKFVEERDRKLAKEASQRRKQRIFEERSHPSRYDEHLCNLFDAVADAFVKFMLTPRPSKNDRQFFGFKYCPLEDRSADKATGNLDSKGIGYAVLKRFGAIKGFPADHRLSPFSIEFKSWVATYRRTLDVPEAYIGCRQVKQINMDTAGAMHMRNFGGRIHKRHNPEGFAQFEERARQRLNNANDDNDDNGDKKKKKKEKNGINCSNLMPHELLETLRSAECEADETIAELQFLSIIKKTKIPKNICAIPIVDVSGSMSGIPMQVMNDTETILLLSNCC